MKHNLDTLDNLPTRETIRRPKYGARVRKIDARRQSR